MVAGRTQTSTAHMKLHEHIRNDVTNLSYVFNLSINDPKRLNPERQPQSVERPCSCNRIPKAVKRPLWQTYKTACVTDVPHPYKAVERPLWQTRTHSACSPKAIEQPMQSSPATFNVSILFSSLCNGIKLCHVPTPFDVYVILLTPCFVQST